MGHVQLLGHYTGLGGSGDDEHSPAGVRRVPAQPDAISSDADIERATSQLRGTPLDSEALMECQLRQGPEFLKQWWWPPEPYHVRFPQASAPLQQPTPFADVPCEFEIVFLNAGRKLGDSRALEAFIGLVSSWYRRWAVIFISELDGHQYRGGGINIARHRLWRHWPGAGSWAMGFVINEHWGSRL